MRLETGFLGKAWNPQAKTWLREWTDRGLGAVSTALDRVVGKGDGIMNKEREQHREEPKRETHEGEDPGMVTRNRGEVRLSKREPLGMGPYSASPFSAIRRFSEEMDRLFEDFGFGWFGDSPALAPRLGRGLVGRELLPRSMGEVAWAPEVEVFERDDKLILRTDLPGLDREDIRVEVSDENITISGERRREKEGESEEGIYRTERCYGAFCRVIALPEGVEIGKANACFRNGVLEVEIPAPKLRQKRGRRIEVKEAELH